MTPIRIRLQETAIHEMDRLIRGLKLDCDWERRPHIMYTENATSVPMVMAVGSLAKQHVHVQGLLHLRLLMHWLYSIRRGSYH